MTSENIDPFIIKQEIEFIFPIFKFDISEQVNIDSIEDKVYELRKNYSTNTLTNIVCLKGWRSPYLFPHTHKEIKFFESLDNIIKSKIALINSFKVELHSLWAVTYSSKDYSEWHNHGSIWDKLAYNVVFYLTNSSTPIVFGNLGKSNLEILPSRGTLIIMHPLVRHMVPEVVDNNERIVIAANYSHI